MLSLISTKILHFKERPLSYNSWTFSGENAMSLDIVRYCWQYSGLNFNVSLGFLLVKENIWPKIILIEVNNWCDE